MKSTPRSVVHAAVVAAMLVAVPAQAQEVLDRVRALYASAAYEDALTAISAVPDAAAKPDLEVYRISCLVALGRSAEAQRAVDTVVNSNPMYQPDKAEASPRIQELFKTARKQLLPGIARRLYTDAKAALDRKDREAAVNGFTEAVRILNEPEAGQSELIAELRQLATGFLDLSRALPVAAAPAAAALAVAEAPPPAPVQPGGPVVPDKGPEPIRQTLPSWTPRDQASSRFGFKGAVKVTISKEGTVESAVIVDSVHRAYDTLLLAAAHTWLYKPAMKNGVAVPSEKIVQVELRPK
jgi:TonB family protein